MKRVLIICEAGTGKGLGHFYRALALAQVLTDHYQLTLLSNNPNLPEIPFETIDVERFELFDDFEKYDLIILDGYAFGSDFISKLVGANTSFIEISDFAKPLYPAKHWINSSINDQYTPGLGLKYSLLRKEILEVARSKTFRQTETNTLFIAFGGTDEGSNSLKVIRQLLPTHYFKQLGILYPQTGKDFDTLKELESEHHELTIFSNLSATDLIQIVDDFSLALVSSSTIACEMIALRKIVFTCCLYENQELLHHQITGNNAAMETNLDVLVSDPGPFLQQIHTLTNLQALFSQQKTLIDGLAADRIRNFIANCFQ